MTTLPPHDHAYRRELGDGLVLRWATPADTEKIADLYGFVFRRTADEPLNIYLQHWTRELMAGTHPLIDLGDIAIVEDTTTGTIAASTCLLKQEWRYEEIAFPVGRPEIVASMPQYRQRGLIRAVFELIHARSDQRGDLAQGITGIPYYYRQFGYEFALDLHGDRFIPLANIPKLKEGEAEPYTMRAAEADDLPFIQELYAQESRRLCDGQPLAVASNVPADYWPFALASGERQSGEGLLLHVLTDAEGQRLAYAALVPLRWGEVIFVRSAWVAEGVNMRQILPSLLRGIQSVAAPRQIQKDKAPEASVIALAFGASHPFYQAAGGMIKNEDKPYAWYVRVADLPAFIRHIQPVLERRLAESPVVRGHSGELRISFYRGGLRMAFEQGRLTAVEPWKQGHNWEPGPMAAFPPLVFSHVLMGHRSIDELRIVYPDVWADDEGRPLIEALFPKRTSWVLSLE
ncbi:GNAT family N-acetyltransferase [Chloroflexia bacterium SDU3-3]|nr:GNAT family N-acetyltransferase [Chloroflexia bacterium SDU3-3]